MQTRERRLTHLEMASRDRESELATPEISVRKACIALPEPEISLSNREVWLPESDFWVFKAEISLPNPQNVIRLPTALIAATRAQSFKQPMQSQSFRCVVLLLLSACSSRDAPTQGVASSSSG